MMLEGYDNIFDINVAENIAVVKYNVGDAISFSFIQESEKCTVTELLS